MLNTRILIAVLAAAVVLSGCNSQQKQAEKHDEQMRQQVQQLKQKSKAYPVNGSNTNHYIP